MSRAKLRKCAKAVKVTSYLDYKEYLGDVYREVKEHIYDYSYLKFSEELGFGANNVIYLIIQGQRPLTEAAAEKVIKALALTGTERQYFANLVATVTGKTSEDRESHFRNLIALKNRVLPNELDKLMLEFYSDWYHGVILEMVSMPEFKSEPGWISRKIFPPLSVEKVKESLDLLQRIEFITIEEESGRYVKKKETFTTGDEVLGMAVTRYHQKMIELAGDSIMKVAPDKRDISSVTAAVSHDVAMQIKSEIQNFQKRILELTDGCPESDQVVQVNVQLFPLTKLGERREKKKDA